MPHPFAVSFRYYYPPDNQAVRRKSVPATAPVPVAAARSASKSVDSFDKKPTAATPLKPSAPSPQLMLQMRIASAEKIHATLVERQSSVGQVVFGPERTLWENKEFRVRLAETKRLLQSAKEDAASTGPLKPDIDTKIRNVANHLEALAKDINEVRLAAYTSAFSTIIPRAMNRFFEYSFALALMGKSLPALKEFVATFVMSDAVKPKSDFEVLKKLSSSALANLAELGVLNTLDSSAVETMRASALKLDEVNQTLALVENDINNPVNPENAHHENSVIRAGYFQCQRAKLDIKARLIHQKGQIASTQRRLKALHDDGEKFYEISSEHREFMYALNDLLTPFCRFSDLVETSRESLEKALSKRNQEFLLIMGAAKVKKVHGDIQLHFNPDEMADMFAAFKTHFSR